MAEERGDTHVHVVVIADVERVEEEEVEIVGKRAVDSEEVHIG